MPLSTDVNLPRDVKPRWPDRCVCCGRAGPGGTVRVWTASIGWWTVVLWQFRALYSVRVPACPPCGRRLRAARLARFVVTWALAIAGVAVAMWVLGSYQGAFRKPLGILIALVCLSPFLFWEVVFPPAFDVTCFRKTVDFEFRDPAYAAEFESMNRGQSGPS